MADWCATRTTDAAIEALGRAGIPTGPVLHPAAVMAHPQVRATGFVEDMRYPGTSAPAPVMGAPLTLSEAPRPAMTRAPQAGEHSEAILAEIGYPPDAIAAFVAAGTVGRA